MKEIRFVKFLVLLNGAVPAVLLGIDALRGQLGANPVNFAIRTTGLLSLICLLLVRRAKARHGPRRRRQRDDRGRHQNVGGQPWRVDGDTAN